MSAAGIVTATDVNAGGGQSDAGGGAAGQINIAGASVTANSLSASGAEAPVVPGPGGPGGTINVSAPGGASIGSLSTTGGSADGHGAGGAGGTINVTSMNGSIAAGNVESGGGHTPLGPGANGGPITLSAGQGLTVGGALDATGSNASGSSDPALGGGNGGALVLRADSGTLTLGGTASSAGGTGNSDSVNGKLGGVGGVGGAIEVVAHALGPIVSLSSQGGDGGNYGTDQGPGGAGGAIAAFTDGPLFNAQQDVTSDGGNGNPTAAAGQQRQDSSPASPVIDQSTGVLSFTSRSLDAQRYDVLRSVAGAPAQTVLETTKTSELKLAAPLCKPVTFTVVAIDSTVGWTSDPSPAVSYQRRPSAHQSCSQPPRVKAADPTRTGTAVTVRVATSGVGKLAATLSRAGRTLTTTTASLTRAGHRTLRLRLTRARPGRYVVRITATSPDGTRHATATLALDVTR